MSGISNIFNDPKVVRERYRLLLNDNEFERLELELQTPNIFEILNISRAEIRHSNFLRWLLDPNGNHGLGKMFLMKFLREVAISDTATEIDEFEINDLNYNKADVRREWNNIDLLILFENVVFCIENKIDTKDHSNQLAKYKTIIEDHFQKLKKVYVYLTPNGEEPNSITGKDHYVLCSYQTIIEHLESIINVHGKSINPSVYQYISDYIVNLKRDLMKNDHLNDLASKIYKNHKELLDFIIENKPDLAWNLYPIFENFLVKKGMKIGSKNKGAIKFLTPNLHEVIPRKGEGWPLKENFLFELDFFWNNKNKALFKTVITPGDAKIKEILTKALKETEGAKIPFGVKWVVHFQLEWKFTKEAHESDIDEDSINQMLEEQWDKLYNVISKVEENILKYKSELLALKD